MIMNIRELDHGSYQCRAENEVESLDAVAELIVQGIFALNVKFLVIILCYQDTLQFNLTLSFAEVYKEAGG